MAELKTPTAKITKYLIEQGFPVIEMSVSGPVQNDTLHKLPNLWQNDLAPGLKRTAVQ